MMVSIDPLNFIGAEFTTVDGTPGVFIPLVPNIKTIETKKGKKKMLLGVKLVPSKSVKSMDYVGFQDIPKQYLDTFLESPGLIQKQRVLAWGWKGGPKDSGFASAEDLSSLLDD